MRTEENLAALVAELETNCGDFFEACRECRLSPSFVRKWMNEDSEVKTKIEEAGKVGALRIESEAIRRAVKGVEEDIYYQGEVVGSKTNYSDGLMSLILKKRLRDTYGDEPAQTNVQVLNNINVMPRANSYEEWLGMVEATNNQQKALPAPDSEPLDVEFKQVLPPPELDPNMADIL